jgi:hypothetical protein
MNEATVAAAVNAATGYYLGTIGTVSTGTTTNINGYSGTGNIGITTGTPSHPLTVSGANFNQGLTLQGNSTINYSTNQIQNNMSRQVKVAVFTIKRNNKNEIISSEFIKEFWVEQKNGGSIVLAASKQLDKDFDPDTTVIREILTVSF